jgi:hypothetical protein
VKAHLTLIKEKWLAFQKGGLPVGGMGESTRQKKSSYAIPLQIAISMS